MTYYFDVLPLHPQPEYLESLTSYLMRLATLNGISSVDGISTLSFPHQDRRITRDMADYPPLSLDQLMTISTHDEEVLQRTTFFHLSTKFGRSTLPQPISRFLSGCISHYLRYCPRCIVEQQVKYYLLSWRFLTLTSCCKHKCRFLETCGHCSELIPLFASPFQMGYCPHCQRYLGLCTTSILDEAEFEADKRAYDDILFLLTPQVWEGDCSNIIKRVGRQFIFVRQQRKFTVSEFADQIGVTMTVVEGIERGDVQRRGATLEDYLSYAHYLQLSLKHVFNEALCASEPIPFSLPLCPSCQRVEYVIRVGHNRSGSRRYECRRCHRGFTELTKFAKEKFL